MKKRATTKYNKKVKKQKKNIKEEKSNGKKQKAMEAVLRIILSFSETFCFSRLN